jgi:hypothetical protein
MYDNDIRRNERIDPDWGSVAIGTEVVTSDGRRLGTVQEKRDDGLFVHGETDEGVDYLVTPADIGHVDAEGVHLIVTESQAMRAHWQGTSASDRSAPGGMAPGAMTRETPTRQERPFDTDTPPIGK